jgi:glycosyltransferase involved in cell wall biosynthesis
MPDLAISAIVPNYNHAQYLPRSIGALLDQPVLPCEIIVVDDASKDNSLEVLDGLARKHPLIRVLPNEKNLGCNASMNRAMAQAKADFVLFTAADDEVRPGVFEQHTRMLKAHPNAAISSGISEWRCMATGMKWYNGGGMPDRPCFLTPAEMSALCKRGKLAINNQSAVYSKAALTAAGGWIPEFHWFADVFADAVVGFRHGMCHVPEVLSNFYLNPGSYFNASTSAYAARRAVMHQMLEALEGPRFADVAPIVRQSGFMGSFGWPMARVVLGHRSHWPFLTSAFIRRVSRRSAEIIGRRFFPDWLARFCLKAFYGR